VDAPSQTGRSIVSTPASPERRTDPEEVVELFRRLPDAAARDELTRRFLPFAEYLARRFTGRGELQEDLEQVAGLGLVLAIDRFDVDRGVAFSTYAAATIIGELKRHFRDKGWAIRVPRLVQEHSLDVGKAAQALWQELGRSPTIPELARRTGLNEEEVLEAIDASQAYRASSIDAPLGEDGASHADMMGGLDEALEMSPEWATVSDAVKQLPLRERTIVFLRFFRGLTQTEIAEEVGISQMHVSRLLAQTLRQLRGDIGGSEAGADPGEAPASG
jgi:RNA polymerase sigma-B factor